uniref:Mitochondrial import inner membrane translocase subunit n=1 Tax=Pseudo-nitzschia australis TaxID=44445 RepID=A0A7S4A9Z0_9STRA
MASAATQAQANALNAKMEGEASKMLDEVERHWMRKVARQSFACALKCYDKAGTSGPAESLESCTRNCQAPYQQSSNLIQQVRKTYRMMNTFFPRDFGFTHDKMEWNNMEQRNPSD